MKCHLSTSHLLLTALILVSAFFVEPSRADANAEVLQAEAEERSAQPFLDRLASALFGSSDKKDKNTGGNKKKRRPSYQRPLAPAPSYQTPVIATKPSYQPTSSSYGAPQAPVSNSYGAPQGPVIQNRPPPPRLPQPPSQPSFSRPPTNGYQSAPSNNFPSVFNSGGPSFSSPAPAFNSFDTFGSSSAGNSMAQIKDLQVQCEKDLMRVRVEFDRPFYGMIFSKGHYSNINCVHVPASLGQTQATFDISLSSCGMSSSLNDGFGSPTPQGSYIENTIIIQYDPLLQEVWDQARKLRCTWYDFYEKAVTFRPYQVDMLDPVTANFLGDNLRCWMQIQVGKGPHASEVSGIVKIGQTMTMVLGVKDDENKFDMMVRNCVAHDGQRSPIQLVDEKGCVVRSKIMSPFKKVKNFDTTANVLAYAYFQAFKFPDSMNVHFQCVVQVCRGSCPDPVCGNEGGSGLSTYSSSGGSIGTGGPSPSGYSNSGSSGFGGPSSGGSSFTAVPNQDGYGSPNGPALDSYGSPLSSAFATAASNIDPRYSRDTSTEIFSAANSDQVNSLAGAAQALTQGRADDVSEDKIELREPGYEISKRTLALGKGPRNLDGNDIGVVRRQFTDTKIDSSVGEDFEVRHRRSAEEEQGQTMNFVIGNGVRLVRVKREVLANGEEGNQAETAELETEKVIQVLAPNDIQFSTKDDEVKTTTEEGETATEDSTSSSESNKSSTDGAVTAIRTNRDRVIFDTDFENDLVSDLRKSPHNFFSGEAVCIDTPAFVGVTVSFLMILIVALITIVFLWLRIRSFDEKKVLL